MAGGFGLGDLQRHVRARFTNEAVFDLARGEQFAFAPGQRRIVHTDLHGDRGRVNMHKWKRLALFIVCDCLADKNVLKSGNANDIPLGGAFDLDLLQSFMAEERGDVGACFLAVGVKANGALADFHTPAGDAPVSDAAEIVTVVEIQTRNRK